MLSLGSAFGPGEWEVCHYRPSRGFRMTTNWNMEQVPEKLQYCIRHWQ
jgi:hypothetical protein